MTPYEIKLLLDIYTTPNCLDDRQEPILQKTIEKFESHDLIRNYGSDISFYQLTDKGLYHISQLCSLPFPQEFKRWIDFAGNEIPSLK